MGPCARTEPQLSTSRTAAAWAAFEFIPISAIRAKITGLGQGRCLRWGSPNLIHAISLETELSRAGGGHEEQGLSRRGRAGAWGCSHSLVVTSSEDMGSWLIQQIPVLIPDPKPCSVGLLLSKFWIKPPLHKIL